MIVFIIAVLYYTHYGNVDDAHSLTRIPWSIKVLRCIRSFLGNPAHPARGHMGAAANRGVRSVKSCHHMEVSKKHIHFHSESLNYQTYWICCGVWEENRRNQVHTPSVQNMISSSWEPLNGLIIITIHSRKSGNRMALDAVITALLHQQLVVITTLVAEDSDSMTAFTSNYYLILWVPTAWPQHPYLNLYFNPEQTNKMFCSLKGMQVQLLLQETLCIPQPSMSLIQLCSCFVTVTGLWHKYLQTNLV